MFSSVLARVAVAAALVHAGSATAQENPPATSGARPPSEKERNAIFAAFVEDKLSELLSGKSGELRLKYIEPDTSGSESGWGIDYEWNLSKSGKPSQVPKRGSTDSFTLGRLSSELAIKGTYAFSDVPNNQNQSTITGALKLERGNFGKVNVLDKAISDAFQKCLLEIPVPTNEEDIPEYNRASSECTRSHGIDEMIRNTPDAYYYWVDFHGGVEANQDYSDSRTLFGLAAAYVRQPGEARASRNFLDAPFRFMRNQFSVVPANTPPYVAPYPSLLLGIERLDANDDDTRTALTTKTTFTRAKAEVAFNTVVANIGQQLVRFNVSYRYFHELSAPDAIEAAGLDNFDFVSASLRFPAQLLPFIPSDDYELFVSYTNGQLPFNTGSDRAIEVGFATNIQALADFLAQ